MTDTCCFCGSAGAPGWFCDRCSEWGLLPEDVSPTWADTLGEQFHRLGRDGRRYWGRLGAGLLFTDGNKVLLLRRASERGSDHVGTWGIPGGKAKKNETPLDAARRESREECGSDEGRRIAHFHDRDGSHHFHTFLVAVDKSFEVKLSDEHDGSKWVGLDQVLGLPLHPRFKLAWPAYRRAIEKQFPARKSFSEWAATRLVRPKS